MAHNSTDNLIQSDSSTSTDELNNGTHSRSVEKVSKKMFHKKKTAFVGANSVTSPSSSVTSSPQQHPTIVVGTADVHEPPKPLPRKHSMTTTSAANRKHFPIIEDVLEISVSGESESDRKTKAEDKESVELYEIKSQSGSAGGQSDKMEESQMFFARSRKNTVVTNLDEVSVKSSDRSNKSLENGGKPQPKPRQLVQPQAQYEIVHEKSSKIMKETPEKNTKNAESVYSQSSITSNSESETFTKSEISNFKNQTKEETEKVICAENIQMENLIGIYIHSSSELKYDYTIQRPMVRCSVIDMTTGQLLLSRKTNGKDRTQQINLKNVIQPVITKGCRFTSSKKFHCQWEQLLMIEESITHIMQGNIIIFFEILDSPSIEPKTLFSKISRTTEEWHYVCWGFLKPGINCNNIDRRCCLQLFRYKRRHFFRKCSLNVYDQFQLDRIKYPATLTVTVKGINPLQSPVNFPQKREQTNFKSDGTSTGSQILKFTGMQNTSIAQSNFLRRLPGQICKHPNIMYKTHLEPSSKGCLVSKFSPNGHFLAYSFNSDYNIQIATVPDLKVINTLRGHTNFVYDLDWMVDKRKKSFPLHLLSASSDRTAILWTIEKDRILLTILPHPSFLYAAKFLVNLPGDECCLFAVTGGRDCTLRVWKVVQNNNFDLLQESVEHKNYITSIVCPMKGKNLYSSDWDGLIFEWANETNSTNFQVIRKFPKLTDGILSLQLHPKNEQRLYAQLKNHQINCIDTSNEIVLNTVGSVDDDQNINSKFTISPCGSTIYTISWDTIGMYNVLTGTLQSSLKVSTIKYRKSSYVSHLDYHPKLFLLSAAVYGVNGGIVLFSHKSEINSMYEEPIHQDSFDDRWKLLKDNVNPKSSEMLGNIIQRIDDILHQPLQRKNETDDFKNKNISNLNRTDASDQDDDAEVGLLNIVSESESDSTVASDGTFTIRKQSISEASNRTFTLNKNATGSNQVQRCNDGTYSIEADDNSDDTTISESM